MVSQNSKKIKKPSKFNDLVQQKNYTKVKVVQNRNALVKEYKSRNKTSKVEDRRFMADRELAEKNFEPVERGKRKKMAFFNLDSDDDNLQLTHKGVNLDELDDFKDADIDRSVSDDEGINAEMVQNLHFEGFDEDGEKDEEGFNERRKSKQEIYKELIHKSKKLKFQRQRAQEEAEMKIEELDEGFESIAHMLIRNPNQYKEEKQAKGKDDYYLKLQNELAYDKRIKPEAKNAVDPKLAKKRKAQLQEEEEEEDVDSELGIEDDKRPVNKERKLQTEMKVENKTKKFMSFLDDIRNIKNAKGKGKDEDDLDDLDIDSDEEEGEDDDDEEGGDDDDDEGDEDEDDDDEDDE